MDRHVEFVKEQIANQEKLAAKFSDQPHRAGMHYATAARFRELIVALEGNANNDTRKDVSKKLNVSLVDLEGLPSELMAELSISEGDKQEMVIEDIIEKNGGVISLDKLLVEFYRREREVIKRNTLTSRLFRMAEKGMIFNVPGKRGYYSVAEMGETEVGKIFGRPDRMVTDETPSVVVSDAELDNSQPRLRLRRRPTLDIS